jgi:outer membrane lipoprotein SlyB
MKKSTLAVSMAFALAAVSSAFAKETHATIQSIDNTITLDSGRTIHLPEQIEVETMKIGERVAITFGGANNEVVKAVRHIK